MIDTSFGNVKLSSLDDKLLRFGILIESIAGFPNDNMITVVNTVSKPGFNQTALFANPEIKAIAPSLPVPPAFILAFLQNFLKGVRHDNSAELPIVIHLVLTSIAGIAVLLRLYSRKKIIGRIKPEDWAITVSLLITILFAYVMWAAVFKAGAGSHIYDISFNTIKKNMKYVYFAEILYQTSLITVRSSVLLLYYGLTPDPSFRRPVYVVAAANIVLFIIRVSFAIFQCKPLDFWNSPLHKVCIGQNPTWYIVWGSLSVVLDIACLALPIPIVWKLNMAKRERLMVIGVFLVGTIACVGSIARLFFVKSFLSSADGPYAESPMAIWSLVELDLGIMASCAPAIKALIVKHAPNFFGNFTRKGSSTINCRGEAVDQFVMIQNRVPRARIGDPNAAYDTALSNSSTLYTEEDAERWEIYEMEEHERRKQETEKGLSNISPGNLRGL